jgi:hypothetical protein
LYTIQQFSQLLNFYAEKRLIKERTNIQLVGQLMDVEELALGFLLQSLDKVSAGIEQGQQAYMSCCLLVRAQLLQNTPALAAENREKCQAVADEINCFPVVVLQSKQNN